jgi:hypothetical protein
MGERGDSAGGRLSCGDDIRVLANEHQQREGGAQECLDWRCLSWWAGERGHGDWEEAEWATGEDVGPRRKFWMGGRGIQTEIIVNFFVGYYEAGIYVDSVRRWVVGVRARPAPSLPPVSQQHHDIVRQRACW